MKQRLGILVCVLCFLLCGCTWMDGSYLSITPHQGQNSGFQLRDRTASNYLELRAVLEDMVKSGTENAVINVAGYRQDLVEEGIANVVLYTAKRFPLGAYAIEDISYEIGSAGGRPAVSINISYIHGRSEIRKIAEVADMREVREQVIAALNNCNDSVVLWVKSYQTSDLVQIVEDYAKENPNVVMELPQVAVGVYPDTGSNRIVEVKFTYETSRESLRQMQQQVRRVFASAQLYISADAELEQKYSQLYTFLMERFDYQLQTSITPAYSLLNHGVGDCEIFASVYAAMCRQAGLDCQMVSGTKFGQSWYWNIIREDGVNYHVDLLRCSEEGQFQWLQDEAMEGYVWDYAVFPYSVAEETQPDATE